jgi:hypothetical protein
LSFRAIFCETLYFVRQCLKPDHASATNQDSARSVIGGWPQTKHVRVEDLGKLIGSEGFGCAEDIAKSTRR